MRYESPITVMFNNVGSTIDNYVMTQIEEVGVVIDKYELIRALNYDRDQYYKGLEEGVRAASINELLDELRRRLEANNEHLFKESSAKED